MELKTVKKVVIITESSIKDEIITLFTDIGVKGYTIDNVCGRGERGIRDDDSLLGEYLRNIRIETLTTEDIAKKIVASVVEEFFNNYAGIAYMYDVEVVREEKFRT